MSVKHHVVSKPQSAPQPKPEPKPEQKPEHESQANNSPQPASRGNDPGHAITGGVDSRTQFLATQNIRKETQPGSKPEVVKADGNIPDSQDENGLTAQQLNTTGKAAAVSNQEIEKAAGGDQAIVNVLKKLDTDVEGHKELRLALDKGTTYHEGQLPGNEIGLTETGSGHGPVITLKSLSVDTAAHETAHAAYSDMSHAEVYRLGHRVEQCVNAGITRPDIGSDPATTPNENIPPSNNPPVNNGSNNPPVQSSNNSPASGGSNNPPVQSSNNAPVSGGSNNPPVSQGTGSQGAPAANANSSPVNTTIAQLPPAGNITDAELSQIAGGDPQIIAALKFMMKDPDGAKLVQMMVQKHGTVVDDESLSGGEVGLAPVGGDNPVVKIKKSSLDNVGALSQTLFHEMTHVSGDPGDANHNSGNDGHDSVYNAQKAFAQRMGVPFIS